MTNRAAVAEVMNLLTLGQGREFSADQLGLWGELLEGLHGPTLVEATRSLLATSDASIAPATIRGEYDRLVKLRLAKAGVQRYPSGLGDPKDYIAYQSTWVRQVIAGAPVEVAEQRALAAAGLGPDALESPRRRVQLPKLMPAPPAAGGGSP